MKSVGVSTCLLLAAFAIGCDRSPSRDVREDKAPGQEANKLPGKPKREPIATIYCSTLFQEYDANPIAADAKYKGKYIQVEFSHDIKIFQDSEGRNCIGSPAVASVGVSEFQFAMMSPQERQWHVQGYPPNVVCVLADDATQEAATLTPEHKVGIVGKVVGRKPAIAWKGFAVQLTDCGDLSIQEPNKKPIEPVPQPQPVATKVQKPQTYKIVHHKLEVNKTAKIRSTSGETFARVFATQEAQERWAKAVSADDQKSLIVIANEQASTMFTLPSETIVTVVDLMEESAKIKHADDRAGWVSTKQLDPGSSRIPEQDAPQK